MTTRLLFALVVVTLAWGGTPKPGDPGPTVTLTNRSLQAVTVSPTGGPSLISFTADPALAGGDLFHVNVSDPAAIVSLITPGGMEITASNAASLGYNFAVFEGAAFPPSIPYPFSPQGTHTMILLPSSSPNGVWQVKVDASAAAGNVVTVVEYYSSSQVRAAVTTGARQYQQGDSVGFSGLLFDNATPVVGATVTVVVGDPADLVTPPTQVALSDSGSGTGVYSGSYTPSRAGTFTAVMSASGLSTSGVNFARTASTEFTVQPALARISSVAEAGADDHHVGLIDRVNVTANLTVSTAGSYQLAVTLASSSGTQIIGTATDSLSGGSGKLTVSFLASALLQLGVDGPYAISAMLSYLGDPTTPMIDSSTGTTAPYSQQAIDRGSNNLLSVTPVSLDFGSVAAGSTKDLTVTIGNNGTNAFTASAASLSNSAFKVTTPALPFTIPAGGKQAMTVRFSPTAAGAQQDTLGVNGILVAITGTGTAAAAGPQISVNPASVDFGAVAVGQAKTATFSVSNTGGASLTVSGFTFSNPMFAAVSPATPVTVAAGAQQTVTLSFNPTAAGSQTGTLAIASNAGPASVSLSGTANPAGTGSGGGAGGATTLNSTLTITGSGTNSGGNISASGTVTLSGIGSGAFSSNFNLITAAASGSAPITITINSGSPTGTLTGTLTGSPTLLAQVLAGTPSASGAATITITGGTGGFAGATGMFSVTASGTGAGTTASGSGNFSITGAGTINIPSSSGAGGGMTGGGTTSSGTSVQLSIDDGSYELNVGVPQGAATVYFVNRLTPPSYPATLRAVQIFFSGAANALRAGDPITVLAGTTSGGSNINGVSLARTAAQVNASGQLNTYNVAPVTIQSGDFVVGFAAANPPNDFLMADDTSSGSKQRSYLSSDGVTFTLTDTVPQIAGNFAIRALVDVGVGGGTTGGTGGSTAGGSAGTALVSDSFKRGDATTCSLGQADLVLGGSGSHFYLPIFPGMSGPVGASIVSGALQNNGLDFGGVQLTASAGACTNLGIRGENLGQDLDIRVDLLVPGSSGKITNAGPYFRSRAAAAGDGITGGTSAGYWVRLVSTGEIRVTGLNPFALIATSGVPASFNAGAVHTLEIVARGSSLQVSLDGAVQTFTQSGATVTTVTLPASPGSNDGTAGIAFSSEDNRGLAGGQRAGNLVISTVK